MMKHKIEEIKAILEKDAIKALEEISKISELNSDKELLMLRAKIYQALNRNTDAINDYVEILKNYGPDEEAENNKKMLETIVGITQFDIFACTNLHVDPWD